MAADRFQYIQPPDRVEALAQVGDHELDQALRLVALELGLLFRGDRLIACVQRRVALVERKNRKAGKHRGQRHQPNQQQPSARSTAAVVALHQGIKADPHHCRGEFEFGESFAIAVGARICCQRRVCEHLGRQQISVDLMQQCRRETRVRCLGWCLRGARFAADDQRQDFLRVTMDLEPGDFVVDPR
ncbi:MAG: hypothetical protein Q8L45_03890 [Xanthomonadaceae bacterium]|nr:hypothetical protein [Xanthomonadaceae bacterium]MDZ4378265.1 hypothetical protein [Xanthomonadaceae bacterium]